MKTVSLELSKQLKANGYPQEGSFRYWGVMYGNGGLWCKHVIDELDTRETRFEWFSSPAADEILEQLPSDLGDSHIGFYKDDRSEFKQWEISYTPFHDERVIAYVEADSLANAAAKMFLFLKKEGLI